MTDFIQLTTEEQLDKYNKMKSGDEKARHELIESVLPWVLKIIKKKFRKGWNFAEAKSDAYLTVVNCVDKWEPEKGSLSNLVYWGVMNALHTYAVMPKRGAIYIPTSAMRDKAISKAKGEIKECVKRAMGACSIYNSLDTVYKQNGTYIDYQLVDNIMSDLSEQDKKIIRARFGLDAPKVCKSEDIMAEFGLSKSGFNKRAQVILAKLKAKYVED